MAIKFSGIISVSNGGDGLHLVGSDKTDIIIEGGIIAGNDRCGVHMDVTSESNVHMKDIFMSGNKSHGINIVEHSSIMETLGLPIDTNPTALAKLLLDIGTIPKADAAAVIEKSSLWETALSRISDSTTVLANIIDMASNESVNEIIKKLFE